MPSDAWHVAVPLQPRFPGISPNGRGQQHPRRTTPPRLLPERPCQSSRPLISGRALRARGERAGPLARAARTVRTRRTRVIRRRRIPRVPSKSLHLPRTSIVSGDDLLGARPRLDAVGAVDRREPLPEREKVPLDLLQARNLRVNLRDAIVEKALGVAARALTAIADVEEFPDFSKDEDRSAGRP